MMILPLVTKQGVTRKNSHLDPGRDDRQKIQEQFPVYFKCLELVDNFSEISLLSLSRLSLSLHKNRGNFKTAPICKAIHYC